MILSNVGDFKYGTEQVQQLYLGSTLLWPVGPISSTDFLKYYNLNMRMEFKSFSANSSALYSQWYSPNSFLGPDDGLLTPYIDGKDQFNKYDASNIPDAFKVVIPDALYDQDMSYVNTNIPTEFISNSIITNGLYDQWMNNVFNGPDDGLLTPYIDGKDQFNKYDASNIPEAFKVVIPDAMYDLDMSYVNTNIPTEFISNSIITNGLYDQWMNNIFLGPDDGIQTYIDSRDQFNKYDASNIPNVFTNLITGLYDQNYLYNNINIQSGFINNADIVQVTDFDQMNLPIFVGPDVGKTIIIDNKDQFNKYDASNIPDAFTNNDTGEFDQNFAYDSTNITTQFLQ